MSVLSAETQSKVEAALVEQGLLTADKVKELKKKADKDGEPFFSVLISDGHISDEDLTKTIAHAASVPYVNLSTANIPATTLSLLPKETAERYMAVPLGEMQNRLVVAMLDAENVQAIDFLSNKIGRPVKVFAASEAGIRKLLQQYPSEGKEGDNLDMAAGGIEVPAELRNLIAQDSDSQPETTSNRSIKTIVQDSPISKVLTAIMEYAATNGASDIHIEPLEKELKIRCRIDGVLREVMRLPKATEPPLVSRIKILSSLKIDEHRLPQDGQFTVSGWR
jgi:type IV pilus assembly protein PilB